MLRRIFNPGFLQFCNDQLRKPHQQSFLTLHSCRSEGHVCFSRRSIYPLYFKSKGLPASLMIQKLTKSTKNLIIKSRLYKFVHIFISVFVKLEETGLGTTAAARTPQVELSMDVNIEINTYGVSLKNKLLFWGHLE